MALRMAIDYFLKIDGISGESLDSKHKGEIDVESWSWGEANPTPPSGAGGGGGAGKVQMQDFNFTTKFSKASPSLMLACASGKHLKSAVLTARKAGKEQLDFLTFSLSDVLVSAYQTGGVEGEVVHTEVDRGPAPDVLRMGQDSEDLLRRGVRLCCGGPPVHAQTLASRHLPL